MTTTHVPTNGFSGVPNAGAPSVPVPDSSTSNPANQGLPPGVPPAGPPPQMPYRSAEPLALPGQTPGMLPQNQQQHNQQHNQQQQATQPQAGQPDLAGIVALLNQAMGTPPEQAQATQQVQTPDSNSPGWLQGSLNDFDVSSIDDPIIKSMATVMQVTNKDLDLDRVLGNALANGDPKLIDFKYLAEKGGANAAQLAEIAKGIVQAVNAKSDSIMKDVYSTVGGEAQWDSSVEAFNKSAPQALRATVSRMLDSTDVTHIKYGAQIIAEYGRASGHIPQQGAPLLNGGAGSSVVGQGLSKTNFIAELGKLNPNSQGYEEARAELFTRRSVGKRNGL